MRSFRWLVALMFLLVSSICCAGGVQERAVLVTIDGVSLSELAKYGRPELDELLKVGGIGLMNNRSDGRQDFSNNAVTIGAGARACGARRDPASEAMIDDARLGFDCGEMIDGEPASQVFARNTGARRVASGVVHTGIVSLVQMNSGRQYVVIPGLLGTQLRRAGVRVGVYGNSDQGAFRSRCAVAIAMDKKGCVPFGDVGIRTLKSDPRRPFGVRSDLEYLTRSVLAVPSGRSFTVVELGDGARLEASSAYLGSAEYERLERATVCESLDFVRRLDMRLREGQGRYLLILAVTSQDSEAMSEGDLLTPVIVTGTGIGRGILTSESTKRSGLIMNLDLAPTLLRFFGITPYSFMAGGSVSVQPDTSALSTLREINDPLVKVDSGRLPILKTFIIILSSMLVLYIVLLLTANGRDGSGAMRRFGYLRPVFIALLLVPLSLLFAPAFHMYSPLQCTVFLVSTTLIGALALNAGVRDTRLILASIGIATALSICIDLMIGAPLEQKSILSYSAITGIRFYGLGNEYSGVLLGSSLLGIFSLLDYFQAKRWYSLLVVLLYIPLFLIVGSPEYGSDFGGMLAVAAGFSMAYLRMRRGVSRRMLVPVVVLFNAALFGSVMAMNMLAGPHEQTHIGHAFSEANQSGIGVLWEIALRKWSMNLRLIRYSFWAIALGSLSTGLIMLCYRPVNALRNALSGHKLLNAGFVGTLASMVVALVTNDSGVVMAATGLLYLALPLILVVESARGKKSDPLCNTAEILKK